VSVTADFQAQFEALVTGLTDGETAFVRSEIETATVAFLKNVFSSLATMLTKLPETADVIQYAPNAFGYEGTTKRITSRWQIRKNRAQNRPALAKEPWLFRGLSEDRGKESLVSLLARLGKDANTGTKLYTGLGGLSLSSVASGSSALKPGLKYSKWTGKAYNPRTKEYVSWKDAVIPAVNHYLRQGAVKANSGARVGSNNRVSVEGRRGQISIQRALVEGLASAGINVSFLSKLNSFEGASSKYDDLAGILEEIGILTTPERDKLSFLHKHKHAILLPYFGALLSSNGKDSLTNFLQKEGVL
jgi:hypothetical protein